MLDLSELKDIAAPGTTMIEALANLDYWEQEGSRDHDNKVHADRITVDGFNLADAQDAPIIEGDLFQSVSGLSPEHALQARHMFQQAAVLGYHRREYIHYTQNAVERWLWHKNHVRAWAGDVPHQTDCSGFGTWVHWQWGYHFHHSDSINGERWLDGYTGTQAVHGRRVEVLHPGDLVLYGAGWPFEHVACYTGGGMVVSHGGEIGPLLLPVHYRGDAAEFRRYI